MEGKINFGDLVLSNDALGASKKIAPKKKASAPVFECVASSGADFVVKRTTATTSRLLVVLVSQEQYYVKNERTGQIEELTEKALESFFQGFGENNLHIGCSWLESYTNNKAMRAALVATMRTNGFKQAASSGLLNFEKHFNKYLKWRSSHNNSMATNELARLAECAESSAPLMKHIGKVASELPSNKKEFLTDNAELLIAVLNTYGLDCARKFVDRLVESSAFENACEARDVLLKGLPELLSIVPTRGGITRKRYSMEQRAYGAPITFQFDKLCAYLFEQSSREGFTSLWDWLDNWKDTLLLQLYVGGKITDKYPANLLTVHNILSTEAARMQESVDKAKWAAAVAAMQDYDFAPEGSKYLITHPATPDDMRAEAVAQSNCLASYVSKVLNGHCMIFFARKADNPEKSLLTIEVNTRNMELAQVKARFNHEADEESMRFVTRWCREKGISLGMYAASRTAARAA